MPAQRSQEGSTRCTSEVPSTLQSLGLSSNFSQTDTVVTGRCASTSNTGSRSAYTPNIGDRARQSWGNSINKIFQTPSILSNDPEAVADTAARKARLASNTSDDSPVLHDDSPTLGREPPPTVPAIELPASPIAAPSGPRSFFDPDTDSDEEPVISRASSVRVQKPKLVKHHLGINTQSLHALGSTHVPPRYSGSLCKSGDCLGTQPTRANGSEIGKPPGGPTEALSRLTANAIESVSTITVPPASTITPSSESSPIPELIIKLPPTPARVGVLSAIPSLFGELGSLRLPSSRVSNLPSSSLVDGLSSNPVDPFDGTVPTIQRTFSAPARSRPTPYHVRHVTIRPIDTYIAAVNKDSHQLFRESVISTPYPTRNSSVAIPLQEVSPLSTIENTAKIHEPLAQKESIGTTETEGRFPSPAGPEVLSLELTIDRHPNLSKTVKIPIEIPSTFDDEPLFTAIRSSYTTLLPVSRRHLTARKLTYAAFSYSSSSSDPNPHSFTTHLSSPLLGRGHKTWTQWLRDAQPVPTLARGNTNTKDVRGVSFYSPTSISPATPRMPFSPRTGRAGGNVPRVTLYFSFSAPAIAAAALGVMLLSGLAAVLWVLFGSPRLSAGEVWPGTEGIVNGMVEHRNWRVDAQARVLTGLVLGMFVAVLGSLAGAGWVWMSWILL